MAIFEIGSFVRGDETTRGLVVSLFQIAAIFIGARIGRFFAMVSHTATHQQSTANGP